VNVPICLKIVSANDEMPNETRTPGKPSKSDEDTNGDKQPVVQAKRPRRRKGPNYSQIHSKSLPLDVHPLPAFHPTHPIDLLKLCYVWLSQLIYPRTSHPPCKYSGYFSPETRSVHVTDPAHTRALWEMGFFGKGTLSRSEPSWLEREKTKVRAERSGVTAEEATNARREERRLFKLERARLERERIERQKAVEDGRMAAEEAPSIEAELERQEQDAVLSSQNSFSKIPNMNGHQSEVIIEETVPAQGHASFQTQHELPTVVHDRPAPSIEEGEPDILNQEHLQLTLEEAFFLSYGLGVLGVKVLDSIETSNVDLLSTFVKYSTFIPDLQLAEVPTDSHFMLSYVVYHHFRSLGWVVRPGIKFSVDYLLYNRGPVFSHAEFAVIIIPSYSHTYWSSAAGRERRRKKEQRDWWWLHCVNRVQSQVKKTLVLVYVDIPPPAKLEGESIGELLGGYKVREFVVRRWLLNRSRD